MKTYIRALLVIAVIVPAVNLCGTHLLGQYFEYKYVSETKDSVTYSLKLKVYRDCRVDGSPQEVPFDDKVYLCIYHGNTLFNSMQIKKSKGIYVLPDNPDSCDANPYSCIAYAEYESMVNVSKDTGSYYIVWQRCCRGHDRNLKKDASSDPTEGITMLAKIPAYDLKNNNPTFLNHPIAMVCYNDTAYWRNQFTDKDGDSLSFEMATPWAGGSISEPLPQTCPNNFVYPSNVTYAPGFSAADLFGQSGISTMDKKTGELTLLSKEIGYFSGSMDVIEWRNQKEINRSRLDYTVFVEYNLGTSEVQNHSITISPNPARSEIRITGITEGQYAFTIYDQNGRKVLEGENTNGNSINITTLSAGLYSIQVLGKLQNYNAQMIVE